VPNQMQWVNALSTRPSLEAAVSEVVEQAHALLHTPADLGLVFISAAFTSDYSRLMPLLGERLDVPMLIGCSGGGIIGCAEDGVAHEIEQGPVLSLMLASLPGVEVQAFHLDSSTLPDLDSPPDAWVNCIGVPPQDNPQFILLGDGNSFRVTDCLQGLDFAYPTSAKVGGLASSGSFNGGNALFCNYRYYTEGLVGVALSGNIVLETIVAQGCRPIGPVFQVVEGERNLLLGLEVLPDQDLDDSVARLPKPYSPLELLQQTFQELSESDRTLAQNSLFIGIARDVFKSHLEPGDFLIRNILGVDPRSGAIAVGDRIRPGQRIRFHLRDARTSAEDLHLLLDRYTKPNAFPGTASGAVMFSCLGRGEGLYRKPDFDSQMFQRSFPKLPLSGFFCNGEIGPVGRGTFLHGYTSVFGIFSQP
jgi:small ligand-binding sensory domain FIST